MINLKEIKDAINSNKIYEWDGFDKGVKGSKMKNNFILEVSYSDSRTLTAYGNKEYPIKFDERKQALHDCLKRIVSSYRWYIMKSNDRKRLTEFLKELNISKNTVPVIEQYLKEHNIKYSDYLRGDKEKWIVNIKKILEIKK